MEHRAIRILSRSPAKSRFSSGTPEFIEYNILILKYFILCTPASLCEAKSFDETIMDEFSLNSEETKYGKHPKFHLDFM